MGLEYSAHNASVVFLIDHQPLKWVTSRESSGMNTGEALAKDREIVERHKEFLNTSLDDIASSEGYSVEGEASNEALYLIEAPDLLAPVDDELIRAKVSMWLAFNGEYKQPTAIYAELASDRTVPLGDGAAYHEKLTGVADKITGHLVKEYLKNIAGTSHFFLPFHYNSLGAKVPEEHPLQLIFNEERQLDGTHEDIKLFIKDFEGIHGEAEKPKFDETRNLKSMFDGTRAVYRSTIVDERISNTAFVDVVSFEDFRRLVSQHFVEGLVSSREFGGKILDWGLLVNNHQAEKASS